MANPGMGEGVEVGFRVGVNFGVGVNVGLEVAVTVGEGGMGEGVKLACGVSTGRCGRVVADGRVVGFWLTAVGWLRLRETRSRAIITPQAIKPINPTSMPMIHSWREEAGWLPPGLARAGESNLAPQKLQNWASAGISSAHCGHNLV